MADLVEDLVRVYQQSDPDAYERLLAHLSPPAEPDLPEKPTWPEANPDYKQGDPITPEMVLRTLQSIFDAGEMDRIIAIVLPPKRGDVQYHIRQMSTNLSTVDIIGELEALKMMVYVTALLNDKDASPVQRHLQWHRDAAELQRQHAEQHRDALLGIQNADSIEEAEHLTGDLMNKEVDALERILKHEREIQ